MSENKSCTGNCSACSEKKDSEECNLKMQLAKIKNTIVVMSGKGGVGKSTVSVNLALSLAMEGHNVGLLDVDLHGPSVPKMLHLDNEHLTNENGKLIPVSVGNLKVMSTGFLLENPSDPIIWRGPMKIGVIKQFLTDVLWGELDYLIIDSPPGTGDEPLSVCQFIPNATGAIIVTTPQQVAASDVSKSIQFCRQLDFKILGIVENMSGFACPKCGEITEIFSAGAGEKLSSEFDVPLLGKIPIDPIICLGGDDGKPFVHHFSKTATAKAFVEIINQIKDK